MYTDVFRIYAVYRLCIQDIPSVPRRVKGNPRCTSAFHDDLSTWQGVCVCVSSHDHAKTMAPPSHDDAKTHAKTNARRC